jgi:thiol-disulfide isomerase/thioredoxin
MLIALALCVLGCISPAGDPFTELDYDAALAQAKKDQKLLLVDFTASWCTPCKKMEKETWGAAEVKAWLTANALAVQIDVDEEKELAQRFKIEAMPTVIVMREGVEFDRFVGYRDTKQFLAWAEEVRAGRKPGEALLERAKALRDSTDVDARYEVAREMLRAKQYDEALAHYLWLWPATRAAVGYGGVRLSFMLSDMAQLAAQHEPAKKAFAEILAELQTRVDAAELPAFLDWQEWTGFCGYFDAKERVLAWYEKRRDGEGRLFAGNAVFQAQFIVGEVFDALMEKDRLADAVRLYEDARARAEALVLDYRRRKESLPDDEELRKSVEEHGRSKLTLGLSKLFAALHATERAAEAEAVAELLLETLDTPEARLALVRQALDHSQKPHASYARWLDEAEAAGGNTKLLRRKLEKLAEPR